MPVSSTKLVRVSAQDIADHLGVARPTVSTILSGASSNTRVSEELRLKVMDAAKSMGYRPNAAAKAVARGKFGGAGLITSVDRKRSSLPPDLLWGITQALEERGMHLLVAALPDEQLTDDNNLPRMLSEWMTDGLLINYNKQIPPAMSAVIERHAIPSVWLNSKREYDSVYPNDEHAGRMATEILLQAGHRRITYTGNLTRHATHYSEFDRRAGYEQAMRAAGLELDVIEPVMFSDEANESRQYWIDRLQAEGRPTAVVAYGRSTLEPVVLAAERLGLEIGWDLSLITFADWPQKLGRKLDTVIIPQQAMGRKAVDMLCKRMRHSGGASASVALRAEYIKGQSVNPPRV